VTGMEAGSVAALTQGRRSNATTQTWARHFYDDPRTYGALDGSRYENAHNRATGYVLFERARAFRDERPGRWPIPPWIWSVPDRQTSCISKFAGH